MMLPDPQLVPEKTEAIPYQTSLAPASVATNYHPPPPTHTNTTTTTISTTNTIMAARACLRGHTPYPSPAVPPPPQQ
jgi:hypothetical protein